MTIDVSTGDVITPEAAKYDFAGIFDDELTFEVWAYNIETVLKKGMTTPEKCDIIITIYVMKSFDFLLIMKN